ncbi:lysylphosphatidylglycerol synthase transmembrane domain-containing protein [Halalkalicoccus sp. GCM10025322]|uniref:lysylphosphatidylglycerol synthase transmembrane domain-containing protein n=1 Tax=Halalkalicoccus TaxID=332246 RepID=UPI002F96C942
MDGWNWRALLIGFTGALILLGVLFFVVGAKPILESLTSADSTLVAMTLAFVLAWLGAWGLLFRTVLETLGIGLPIRMSFFAYASAAFANNVTPFGQAGGELLTAGLISKVADARYETGLAGIATVDVLNVVSSLVLIFVGVGYYATTAIIGERLETAVGSAVALVVVLGTSMILIWRYQESITDRIAVGVGKIADWLPGKTADPDAVAENVAQRLRRFFDRIGQMATQRRQLAIAFGFSLLGWLFQTIALLTAFAAIGSSVPIYIALFVIPLGNLAGATPLPGGLGGVEAAFVALLVPTTGIPAATVTAAVLIYRGLVYWLPVVIGGGSVVVFGTRTVA